MFVFHELVCLAVVDPLAVDADAHLSAGGRYQDTGMASSAHDSAGPERGVVAASIPPAKLGAPQHAAVADQQLNED